MAEYIEREAVLSAIDCEFFKTDPDGSEQIGILSCRKVVRELPAADVAPVSDLKEFAEDVLYQFGYKINYNGGLHITAGGLSTLEWAFSILGWEDPHPFPEGECEWDGCHEYASCGTRTLDGYKRVCGKHYEDIKAREEAERNARMDGE
jgi:hypothetical protein